MTYRHLGEDIPLPPRVLMREQSVKVLDLAKIREKAIAYLNKEPNLRCVVREFEIPDENIRVELLTPTTNNKSEE
jgi:hypothetical protein